MKCWVIAHMSEKGGDFQIEVCASREKMAEKSAEIRSQGNREIYYIACQDILE